MELAGQEVGADQLGQLFKGGLQHWPKGHLNEALSHRCPTSKPRKAAQPGEPGASPTVRARPGRGCSTFVRKGSLVQITFIGTASDVSRTWRKQADPATAPHDPPILFRCWCFNEALREWPAVFHPGPRIGLPASLSPTGHCAGSPEK